MASFDGEDFRRQVEEARAKLESWEDREKDLSNKLPDSGLCAFCWGKGADPQPKHYVLLMCPSGPVVTLNLLSWNQDDRELKKEHGFLIDRTAIPGSIAGLVNILYGLAPDIPDTQEPGS